MVVNWVRALSFVFAAIAPLGPNALVSQAEVVAVGKVTKVESHQVAVEGGTNIQFVATIQVEKFEKRLLDTGEKTITVHFWQTGKRPPGWAGPVGQNSVMSVGEHVRVYGRYGPKGELQLLEPNGWERLADGH